MLAIEVFLKHNVRVNWCHRILRQFHDFLKSVVIFARFDVVFVSPYICAVDLKFASRRCFLLRPRCHASGLLCERDGSLRWCSSWTGGWSEDSQIRPFGTDRSPVPTDRSRDTWPVEWVIYRFLFGAGPQDGACFRRQPFYWIHKTI